MSDRFYQQQLDVRGTCPGHYGNPKKRRSRKMAWTDEQKATAIEMYTSEEPTPENSMEIVKSIAEQIDQSANGVRMILTKANVYVKKAPSASPKGESSSSAGTRVSKAAAQEALVAVLTDVGAEIDEDIVSKLTGKAAQYFTKVIATNDSE